MQSDREQIEARLEELRPAHEEYELLQMVLYLVDEGFVEYENGRLYPVGEPREEFTLSS